VLNQRCVRFHRGGDMFGKNSKNEKENERDDSSKRNKEELLRILEHAPIAALGVLTILGLTKFKGGDKRGTTFYYGQPYWDNTYFNFKDPKSNAPAVLQKIISKYGEDISKESPPKKDPNLFFDLAILYYCMAVSIYHHYGTSKPVQKLVDQEKALKTCSSILQKHIDFLLQDNDKNNKNGQALIEAYFFKSMVVAMRHFNSYLQKYNNIQTSDKSYRDDLTSLLKLLKKAKYINEKILSNKEKYPKNYQQKIVNLIQEITAYTLILTGVEKKNDAHNDDEFLSDSSDEEGDKPKEIDLYKGEGGGYDLIYKKKTGKKPEEKNKIKNEEKGKGKKKGVTLGEVDGWTWVDMEDEPKKDNINKGNKGKGNNIVDKTKQPSSMWSNNKSEVVKQDKRDKNEDSDIDDKENEDESPTGPTKHLGDD
jgi:hypothetical protein